MGYLNVQKTHIDLLYSCLILYLLQSKEISEAADVEIFCVRECVNTLENYLGTHFYIHTFKFAHYQA